MKWIALVTVLFFSSITNAVTITPAEIGFTPTYGSYDINDPDGKTRKANVLAPLNFSIFYPAIKKHHRTTARVGISEFDLEASEFQIGQKSQRQYLEGGYRIEYGFSRRFKLWLEGGVGLSSSEHGSRHTVDKDGYLKERFDKRVDESLYAYSMIAKYWKVNRAWKMGFELKGELSSGDNLSGFSVGISILR